MTHETEVAKRFADIYELVPEAYDAKYGVQKHQGTDVEVPQAYAKSCADDPALYDRLYGRPTS